jgi:hypothetical protein
VAFSSTAFSTDAFSVNAFDFGEGPPPAPPEIDRGAGSGGRIDKRAIAAGPPRVTLEQPVVTAKQATVPPQADAAPESVPAVPFDPAQLVRSLAELPAVRVVAEPRRGALPPLNDGPLRDLVLITDGQTTIAVDARMPRDALMAVAITLLD